MKPLYVFDLKLMFMCTHNYVHDMCIYVTTRPTSGVHPIFQLHCIPVADLEGGVQEAHLHVVTPIFLLKPRPFLVCYRF